MYVTKILEFIGRTSFFEDDNKNHVVIDVVDALGNV